MAGSISGRYAAIEAGVFPKVFRRSVVFFREARPAEPFAEWLRADSGADDKLSVAGDPFKRL